jgi:hypothetical protein
MRLPSSLIAFRLEEERAIRAREDSTSPFAKFSIERIHRAYPCSFA